MMGRYQKPAKPGIMEQPRNQCNVANDGGGTQLTNLHATEQLKPTSKAWNTVVPIPIAFRLGV